LERVSTVPSRYLRFITITSLLLLVGVVVSLVSLKHHTLLQYGWQAEPSFCNLGESFNCDAVNASEWSVFLGFPVAAWGLAYYLALLVWSLFARRAAFTTAERGSDALLALTLPAVLISIILLAISEFIIGTICLLCVATYVVNFLLFGVAWAMRREEPIIRRLSAGIASSFGSVLALPWAPRIEWRAALLIALVTAASFILPREVLPRLLEPGEGEGETLESVVTKWRTAPPVTISNRLDGSTAGDYFKGSLTAPIQLVEFSDYECPACRRFYHELEALLPRYGDNVLVIHRNFPIDHQCNPSIPQEVHLNSCRAALFTRCAGEQGRFWEAHAYIFSLPEMDAGEDPAAVRRAIEAGPVQLNLDEAAMTECLASPRPRKRVLEDIEEAIRLDLAGTPSVWVNGRPVAIPAMPVLEAIFDEILSTPR